MQTSMAHYLARTLEPALSRAARGFPAVVLTGPRRAGKTTLLRRLFAKTHGYVSLDATDVRAAASADPRGFLDAHPAPVVIDEIQYAPDLLSHVKERVDAHPGARGRYILTGSQNLLLMEKVGESLAGRAAILTLLPFSLRELAGTPQAPPPWRAGAKAAGPAPPPLTRAAMGLGLLRGGYPEAASAHPRDLRLWHDGYLQTYLERDVRTLRQVGDLGLFRSFLRVLALRSGQLLNLSDASRDLGVAVNTVKAWVSVLEASHQAVVLRPYFASEGKRLVKTPKIYFTDPGLLCHLLDVRDAGVLDGPFAGPVVETAVFAELIKAFVHAGETPRIWFWRTSNGVEVDFLVESGGRLIPLEAKATATPRAVLGSGLRAFHATYGRRAGPGFLVHAGSVTLPLMPGVTALPLSSL